MKKKEINKEKKTMKNEFCVIVNKNFDYKTENGV